ncbi:MAG: hypothetical protein AXA67_12240 [Methylothermaceae bacteria B42]|nr:MAG: hypothetical protein AXA67_12240 [Methylothermaceae bacteria B42]HHJ37923.1 lipopolysaccharide biosynthesis protein [Methylothermaceae bacterium]
MTTKKDLYSTISWVLTGNTANYVLNFITGIILARLLAPEEFGTLLTIQVFTGLAGFFAGGGMVQALIREKNVTKKDYNIVFTLQFLAGTLIYLIFYFSSPWFSKWYNNDIYTDLLRLSAISFVYRPLANLPNSMLQREMRFQLKMLLDFIALLISSISSIILAFKGFGVWSLIWGGIIGSITNIFMLFIITRWLPRFNFDFKKGKHLAQYGMFKAMSDIILYLRNQVSIFILSRTLGPASVGLYNKGESLAMMPHTFFSGSVQPVLFRVLSVEQDNHDRCQYIFFRSIALLAVYATPVYVGLEWLAKPIVSVLYGEKWVESSTPLMILAYAWPFWMVSTLSSNVLAARNWLHRDLFVLVSSLIIMCLSIIIALPHGLKGIALAVVFSLIYTAFHQYFLATSCIKAKKSRIFFAIAPAILLNSILVITLFAAETWIPNHIKNNDIYYILYMTLVGGFSYAIFFLFIPLKSLKTEQQRWKFKFINLFLRHTTKQSHQQ